MVQGVDDNTDDDDDDDDYDGIVFVNPFDTSPKLKKILYLIFGHVTWEGPESSMNYRKILKACVRYFLL